ncbi:MAG: hypothetical protein RI983_816 [Bacteroidota bacterium]|jgi:O-antigen/teichoic acid export membrane protein
MQKSATIFSFIHLSIIQGTNVLLQLFLIPIILRKVGLSEFGLIMLASSYAALISILVNFGSNQTGVKDIALHKDTPRELSTTFYSIYYSRLLFLIVSLVILYLISYIILPEKTHWHFAFAGFIIVSELFNPFFFFVGLQKLLLYNLINLFSKLLSVILILFLIKSPADSLYVNLIIGGSQTLGFLGLFVYIIRKYELYNFRLPIQLIGQYIRKNMYLTGNNLSVQLQQSVFLLSLSALGNASLLGAYSLCDKLVWSARMVIISFFNAIFPKSVVLNKENPEKWKQLKRKLNWGIAALFSIVAVILYFFPDIIVRIIVGHEDALSAQFIQSISIVPLIIGLNVLNVADLLLFNQYRAIFTISIILLVISFLLTGLFMYVGKVELYGFYPLFAEIGSIPLYLYFIKRISAPERTIT